VVEQSIEVVRPWEDDLRRFRTNCHQDMRELQDAKRERAHLVERK
jgi:hypothetical protein